MFKQIELSYSLDALQPHIDSVTMETHYGKHHAAYTKVLNETAEKLHFQDLSIEEIFAKLASVEDESLRNALRNNGGGYYNHNLYFSILSSQPKEAEGALLQAIARDFGSVELLKETLKKAALTRFGSGWAWLSADGEGKLYVSSSPNQDNPLIEGKNFTPILGIDVWEHAYYLNYKNLRGDYIDAFFKVLDWSKVAENYQKIINQ